ncbi:MAG: hypothetical protein FJZ01_18985 [Candidatus Sericytochromatia bacterium]|nr:hypothetical protein [Candidatus Tanganyikabacteria bacterium]
MAMIAINDDQLGRLEAIADRLLQQFPIRRLGASRESLVRALALELSERYRHEGRVIDLVAWLAEHCGLAARPGRIVPFPAGRRARS